MSNKFCTECGNECMQNMRVCPSCGAQSFSTNPPTETFSNVTKNTRTSPARASSGKNLDGVRGWLLFFVIVLTIFNPLFCALMIITTVPVINTMPDVGFKTFMILNGVVGAGIAFYSLYVGVQLWNKNTNAVALAKVYLTVAAVYGVFVGLGTMYTVGRGDPIFLKDLAGPVISWIIWTLYLNKSVRVKTTYNL